MSTVRLSLSLSLSHSLTPLSLPPRSFFFPPLHRERERERESERERTITETWISAHGFIKHKSVSVLVRFTGCYKPDVMN